MRLARGLGQGQVAFLGMDKAPEFIELAFRDMEILPQVQHYQTTVLGRTV
jgi:hypothetical protein